LNSSQKRRGGCVKGKVTPDLEEEKKNPEKTQVLMEKEKTHEKS